MALTFGVGFSDSPESRDALALAAEMASAGHAPLRVLTALHIPSPAHRMFAATSMHAESFAETLADA